MATSAKTFSYAVSVDRDGTARSDEGGSPLPEEEAWSPEHLVLAGLARCILTSLDYHARRDEIQVNGSTEARGEVAQRDTDGRHAFVHIKVESTSRSTRGRSRRASSSRKQNVTASSAPP